MVNVCDYISELSAIDTACQVADGFEAKGILIAREDIDFASLKYGFTPSGDVENNTNIVSAFALKDGKKGVYVKQTAKRAFNGTNTTANISDVKNTINNTVAFSVYTQNAKSIKTLNSILNGDFVMILEMKEKSLADYSIAPGESAYRIYGLSEGLTCSSLSQTPYGDAGMAYAIELTEEGASTVANYLFCTSSDDKLPNLADTETVVATLFDE